MQRLEIGRWFVALVFRLLARALAERFFEFSRTVILLQDILALPPLSPCPGLATVLASFRWSWEKER